MDAMRLWGRTEKRAVACGLFCASLVMFLALAPLDGAFAESDADASGVAKELRQLREKIDEASFHSNASTAVLFVVGLAVAIVAAFGTYKSLSYLRKQSRYFERHLEHLRKDMRIKTRPVLSWVAFEGKQRMRSPRKLAIPASLQ